MMPERPVLDAFGVSGPLKKLQGGKGSAWLADGLVLKPRDLLPQELEWLDTRARERSHGWPLRLSLPVRSQVGNLIEGGWVAYGYLPGEHTSGRWREKASVALAFSGLFTGEPRPPFLDERDHAWAEADRFAWEESSVVGGQDIPYVPGLVAARRPVDGVPCIIHGDLTGNILEGPGGVPAVIDPTLYYRPVDYAVAIIAVDAVCFEGASLSLFESMSPGRGFPQYLLRALLFRIVTDALNGRPKAGFGAYRHAVERVLALAASR
jgi:hypothetical protein